MELGSTLWAHFSLKALCVRSSPVGEMRTAKTTGVRLSLLHRLHSASSSPMQEAIEFAYSVQAVRIQNVSGLESRYALYFGAIMLTATK